MAREQSATDIGRRQGPLSNPLGISPGFTDRDAVLEAAEAGVFRHVAKSRGLEAVGRIVQVQYQVVTCAATTRSGAGFPDALATHYPTRRRTRLSFGLPAPLVF